MHFSRNYLVLGCHKGGKRDKNVAERGQKHNILLNKANNAIKVSQLP